jgi:transcriptional regulator with XRE-family HTH domain
MVFALPIRKMAGMDAMMSRPIGDLLREWRLTRRLSQLDLSLDAGISARHLSYVETGKARPSRDMVTLLADTLEIPLRERNALLVAAGFAPHYRETTLATPEMAQIRRAIDCILVQQEPYPALVMNKRWDLLTTNEAFRRIFGRLTGGPSRHGNVMRQIFDPDDVRRVVLNWEEVAGDLIRHLHQEVAATPGDRVLQALLADVLAYPGVPARWQALDPGAATAPLLTGHFGGNGLEVRFFSTITTFGTPRDITLDDLRIECMFPADDATAALCRELADPLRPRQ